ncbi:SpoIIE family protein phosphatase [Edaphobacter aggregans]|uniref:SpoIIE family protein phosphatase n=1 Tax=Edaphobacter aggregans TaxID=570835 RepID=UPI00068BC561|nr:SpoIIE family protein phosphatase [Edaphobacter aggregans]
MLQRSARLQYLLLALVAFFALTHFVLGTRQNFNMQKNGTSLTRSPFFNGFRGSAINMVLPEAKEAGLQPGDVILTVNQRNYTGLNVLVQELRRSRPNQTMTFGYLRADEYIPLDHVALRTATVVLRPMHAVPTPLWAWIVWLVVTTASFFCLATGLYVVFARPLNPHAWLILGILAYFNSLFTSVYYLLSPLKPVALFWSAIAQTAMPLCLMAFGIYFPDRSKIDIRYPWIKWLFIAPILLLLPIDLLQEFGRPYNFALCNWLTPYAVGINTFETIVSFSAISYFFICLAPKVRTATGDARRRLRILFAGTSIGLTPFFILAIIALFRKTDVGQDVPEWIVLTAVGILFLFPLALAYVVVVQRAMDLRILIRQGTKYAFARRSIGIITVLLAVWMAFSLRQFLREGPGHHHIDDIVKILAVVGIFIAFRFGLARRLQQKLDQRFFREAYSSERILSELSEEARNFTEVTPLLNTITQRIGDALHIERIAVFLRSGDSYRLQFATGISVAPTMSPTLGSFSLAATSATITALTNGHAPASVYRDDPSSWLVDASEAERATLNDLSTELLVPLPGRNRLAGVMALGPKLSEEPYSRTDRQLLQSVATQTGLALENAELFESLSTEIAHRERVSREIEIAREVQQRLFPQVYPQLASVDLAGYCRPAQEVGGDYYDFFLLPNSSSDGDRLALALGDISGKGISSALLMASLRASLRSAAQLQPGDLATLMRHVNRLVYESSTSNRYATFFYAEYDPHTRILTYVNAGHNPPIILRGNESILLEATGTVIGILPDVCYTRANAVLRPGDILIAFTDGISEAMNSADEEWGEDNMVAAARTLVGKPGCTADQLLHCILNAADRFTAGAPQHDDMTLLISIIR